jgi:hypothetical protein
VRIAAYLLVIMMVGLGGLEPPTSPLSGARSSHLSYRPIQKQLEKFITKIHDAANVGGVNCVAKVRLPTGRSRPLALDCCLPGLP